MKGKPIEPGCLAMIVGAVGHPQNNGKIVRVVRLKTEQVFTPPEVRNLLLKHEHPDANRRAWIVETLDGSRSLHFPVARSYYSGRIENLHFDVSTRAVAEKRLKRLDDGEGCKERETTLQLEGIL